MSEQLMVEMVRENSLVGTLALADYLQEHGDGFQQLTASAILAGRLVPYILETEEGEMVCYRECPADDPAVLA